jgi:hypothetical protein
VNFVEVWDVVVGNARGDQKINRCKRLLVKFGKATLDRYGVVVELALDDVDADVLDEPVLVVGGEDVNVRVTIAVVLAIIFLLGGENVVITGLVLDEDCVHEILGPSIIQSELVLWDSYTTVEVYDEVVSQARLGGVGEVRVSLEFVPAALHASLTEGGDLVNLLIGTASAVWSSLGASK